MNQVQFDGNLTRDPEIKHINDQPLANFTLANSYQAKNGNEITLFIECEAWGKRAEEISRLSKGARLEVAGRLKQDSWEDKETGKKRSAIRIVVNHATVPLWALWRAQDGAGKDRQSRDHEPPQAPQAHRPSLDQWPGADESDNDVPF